MPRLKREPLLVFENYATAPADQEGGSGGAGGGTGGNPGDPDPPEVIPTPGNAPTLTFSTPSPEQIGSSLSPLDCVYDSVRNRLWFVDLSTTKYLKYLTLSDNNVQVGGTFNANLRSIFFDDADGDRLYAGERGTGGSAAGRIRLYDIGAGSVSDIVPTSDNVTLSALASAGHADNKIWFLDNGGANLYQIADTGAGTPTLTSSAPTTAGAGTMDQSNNRFYYGQGATQDIVYWDVAGANTTDTTANANGDVQSMAIDESTGDLYFADDDGVNVLFAGETTPVNIVSLSGKSVFGMTAGGGYLYYTNFTDGTIHRVGLRNPQLTGTYRAYVRFLDSLDQPGPWSAVSSDAAADNDTLLTYTNVPTTSSVVVAKRQIARNSHGTTDYYVDIETATKLLATLTSNKTDAQLSSGTQVFPS